MAAWDAKLDPEDAAEVRSLFEQAQMVTPDGEPDWDAARTHVLTKYVAGPNAHINDDQGGAIITEAANGPRLFDSLFDANMVSSAGAGDDAIHYVRGRLIGFMSPGGTAQKLASTMGRVLCEISAQDPETLVRYTYRFTTSNARMAVKYFARPAAQKLTSAHRKTNDKAEVVLAVFDDEETKAEIRSELLKAVIKGIPHLTAADTKKELLGDKPLRELNI